MPTMVNPSNILPKQKIDSFSYFLQEFKNLKLYREALWMYKLCKLEDIHTVKMSPLKHVKSVANVFDMFERKVFLYD